MKQHGTDRIGEHGGIDLATIQKYLNFHYSVSLDLFGSELSTNAANYFSTGLKGRFKETDRDDDHRLSEASYRVFKPRDGTIFESQEAALTALNENLRDAYISDCARALARWNRIIEDSGTRLSPQPSPSRVSSRNRRVSRTPRDPGRTDRFRSRVETERDRVASDPGRTGIRGLTDATGDCARSLRGMDRATRTWNQSSAD